MHAPSPSHILRIHAVDVTVVSFSEDNERLYSGDTSGSVFVTSTRTLRPIATWKAHAEGILSVQEWASSIVTHGRDNKLHVWIRVLAPPLVGSTASSPDLPTPELQYSLDVNALNFCRFSLLCASLSGAESSAASTTERALIAIPNLIESSLADVWELPSCSRLHAAIGKVEAPEIGMKSWQIDSDGRILMSLHLFMKSTQLHLLSAYEIGEVALRRCISDEHEKTIEGRGWECMWRTRQHAESVMAMTVSSDASFALTVSADPIIVRYALDDGDENRFTKHRVKQPGNGAIALRSDGRVCVIGGWDGKIRLFSTKSFKSLGTLSFHTKSCQAVAFAHSNPQQSSETSEEDDELTEEERESRSRWLAVGSQDRRLTIWELISFRKEAR
ncbi:WD40 repeat-like protein [Fomitiporia mediterranea MF3/22]|uniref:WD40 repeat-like protein n=1 Tax=Fomitiporia mediterranea (strain MF3/22) TaxID=694068 RepID=UPI0004409563|nr:WD40 repeat-like protein [Fomitiporia mediterranea MF3/22]EJD06963.1 WD40 repeat-like protein [Fomitiporia mediterranea MF3/22]